MRIVLGQRTGQAQAETLALGIPEGLVKIDRVRGVGRANPVEGAATLVTELCGRCGDGRLAILPDGTIAPCVFGRGPSAGNLLNEGATLGGILAGPAWGEHMRSIPRGAFGDECTSDDSNDCDPARAEACRPAYGFRPQVPTIRLTPSSED